MDIIKNIPKELLKLKNPPKELYFKGNLDLLYKPKIAIIGSRRATTYTKNCVLKLASMLKDADIVVVSGGAIGVDIQAHIASFPNTIGIFANGLDEIYPKNNEKIIKQIYENALAISENKANYKAKPYDFLLRNRLIIALSDVVIIAQADLKSGSMQSARLCKEMKKRLFVLPQRIFESDGTNLLLAKNEAELITDFTAFVGMFSYAKEKEYDDFLEFCKKENSVDKIFAKFGNLLYEYELLGKIEINGTTVRLL